MSEAETIEASDGKPIYTHPDIRTLSHEKLLSRLQNIRDRRLVNAIQYESARVARAHKAGATLQLQWEKINETNRLALYKIDDALDKFEKSLSKQIEISHKISLVEGL